MRPLAVYQERLPERRHRFELYPDAIRVTGATTQAEVKTSIPLARLHPSVTRLRVHTLLFYAGSWVFLAGVVLLMGIAVVTVYRRSPDFPGEAMGLAFAVGLAGAGVVVVNRRKVEYAQFESDAGVPVLGIAKAGRQAADFDAFVALSVEKIRAARGQTVAGRRPEEAAEPGGATDPA